MVQLFLFQKISLNGSNLKNKIRPPFRAGRDGQHSTHVTTWACRTARMRGNSTQMGGRGRCHQGRQSQRRIGLSEISTQITEQQKRMKRDAGLISPLLFCGPDGEAMDTNALKNGMSTIPSNFGIPCMSFATRSSPPSKKKCLCTPSIHGRPQFGYGQYWHLRSRIRRRPPACCCHCGWRILFHDPDRWIMYIYPSTKKIGLKVGYI